eukprot:SAG31_NODE_45219_length_259_cov_1.506250_1_plen_48_part_00
MIYDVSSSLYQQFVHVGGGGGGGPKVGSGGGAKMIKAKGSDGKYQGE